MIYIDKQGRKYQKVKVSVGSNDAGSCANCVFNLDTKACGEAPDCGAGKGAHVFVEVKDE